MPDVKIRRAIQSDAQLLASLNCDVQQIHADAYPYLFRQPTNLSEVAADFSERVLPDERGIVLILEADQQAVGYIYARVVTRPENAYAYGQTWMLVDSIAVKPDCQHQGYGKMLMSAIRDEALNQDIHRIVLDTYEFNTNAQQFYTGIGFERMKIQMTLDLTQG